MPPADSDVVASDAALDRRISGGVALVAGAALVANCLLSCPGRFSERHVQDTSLLRPIVTALSLGGAFPTTRGVEIRDLFFHAGASALVLIAGAYLLARRAVPRLALDDWLDWRTRAAGPFFWWFILLLVSAVSSFAAHAPEYCLGQFAVRMLCFAWWAPVAALLLPTHVRGLLATLLATLAATAALGLWHYFVRVLPDHPLAPPRLRYPMGNETWLAACLLPAPFLAAGLALSKGSVNETIASSPALARARFLSAGTLRLMGTGLAALATLAALYFTGSRAAAIGGAAGACATVVILAGRRRRMPIVLVMILLAIGGAVVIQRWRAEGLASVRGHSIRSRLNYEWPYALRLFLEKPVGGWGDGAYSLLAGQFARDDQLDDPEVISFDEWNWLAHAHNEMLELLADLGLAALVAFLAALGIPLYRAMRFVDRVGNGSPRARRKPLVIFLAAALVAMVVEECGCPAFREPGLPPILLTVWAALWALVRDAPSAADEPFTEVDGGRRLLGLAALRVGGAALCLAAFGFGYLGVQNWRGVRARFEADRAMGAARYADAVRHADFAGDRILQPFQKAVARMIAIWSRSLAFDRALSNTAGPASESDLRLARQALIDLNTLSQAAPRFLRLSRLNAELRLNLARAEERSGNLRAAQEFRTRFVRALEENRRDEPFLPDRVEALWTARPEAGAMEKLNWLRALIRRGELKPEAVRLFVTLADLEEFTRALNDLYALACRDEQRPDDQWQDRLAPETLRLAALSKYLAGQPAEAIRIAQRAADLYRKAGPRLFSGHAAAIHEMVRYDFAVDPLGGTDRNLARLAEARGIIEAPVPPTAPIPAPWGQTRLDVVVAAGREAEAIAQLALLEPDSAQSPHRRLALAYLDVANQFAGQPARADIVRQWCGRALALDPDQRAAHAVLLRVAVHSGDEAGALSAAAELLRDAAELERWRPMLASLRQKFPGSPVWAELESRHPGLTSAPGTTSAPLP